MEEQHTITLNGTEIRYAIADWLYKSKQKYIKNAPGNMKFPLITFGLVRNPNSTGPSELLNAVCIMDEGDI